MIDEAHNERDQRVTADPLNSGALPWLLAEFARIQDRYSAEPDGDSSSRDGAAAAHEQ